MYKVLGGGGGGGCCFIKMSPVTAQNNTPFNNAGHIAKSNFRITSILTRESINNIYIFILSSLG